MVEEVRVAHFDGERWSALGPINRDRGVSMRPPTQANAPQIAIGQTGNAVVVWQEPEIDGVARIWARRIFGSTLDYVLPVSAESLDGAPIEQDADAPSVAISKLGQAEVAYRQGVGAGSPLPGPRIFLNTLPDGESASGAEFLGASIADSQVSGGAGAQVGAPSIDVDEKRDMRLLYDSNGTPRVVEGNGQGLTGTLSLGPPWDGSGLLGASVMNPAGGGVSAWPSAEPGGAQAVAVREDFPSGAVQTALVSGGDGGEIGELAVGRSGLGDGLVAFQQGPLGNAAIVAAHVSAPPAQFVVSVPKGWIKPSAATISWLPAVSADGPLTYEVVLDGRPQPTPAGAFSLRLNPRGLGNGRHSVQVLATDRDGQATLTPPATLMVDGEPPTVTVRRGRHAGEVVVRVRSNASGVDARAVEHQLRRRPRRTRPQAVPPPLRPPRDLQDRDRRRRQRGQPRGRPQAGERRMRRAAPFRLWAVALARLAVVRLRALAPGLRTPAPARVAPAAVLALIAVTTMAAPTPAIADVFGPISLASESTAPVPPEEREQAEYAHDPAISANGRICGVRRLRSAGSSACGCAIFTQARWNRWWRTPKEYVKKQNTKKRNARKPNSKRERKSRVASATPSCPRSAPMDGTSASPPMRS